MVETTTPIPCLNRRTIFRRYTFVRGLTRLYMGTAIGAAVLSGVPVGAAAEDDRKEKYLERRLNTFIAMQVL